MSQRPFTSFREVSAGCWNAVRVMNSRDMSCQSPKTKCLKSNFKGSEAALRHHRGIPFLYSVSIKWRRDDA